MGFIGLPCVGPRGAGRGRGSGEDGPAPVKCRFYVSRPRTARRGPISRAIAMINVTIANFETEVIEASMQTPVLVDFWAPWCGPCKVIGPLLEKIETDYAGRFKLVKI